jgi:hypothetical protein
LSIGVALNRHEGEVEHSVSGSTRERSLSITSLTGQVAMRTTGPGVTGYVYGGLGLFGFEFDETNPGSSVATTQRVGPALATEFGGGVEVPLLSKLILFTNASAVMPAPASFDRAASAALTLGFGARL